MAPVAVDAVLVVHEENKERENQQQQTQLQGELGGGPCSLGGSCSLGEGVLVYLVEGSMDHNV